MRHGYSAESLESLSQTHVVSQDSVQAVATQEAEPRNTFLRFSLTNITKVDVQSGSVEEK